MKPLGNALTHYWLVVGMAHRLGADLVSARKDGALEEGEWAGMVEACRGCSAPGTCRQWLDTRETADAAPRYCRNADRLEALSER